jgi:integrase
MDDYEIKRYIERLITLKKIPASKAYRSVLVAFSKWLSARKKNFDTFTKLDVEEYMSTLQNNLTANMFLGAIRGYIRYRSSTLPDDDPSILKETNRVNQLRDIRPRSRRMKREKIALTPEELKGFLAILEKKPKTARNELIYSGVILTFYTGARPIELAHWLRTSGVEHPAKINWKDRSMQLYTAKIGEYRYIPWHPSITPHLKRWIAALPDFTDPNEWLTRRIKNYTISGVKMTSKTGRRTVQTNFRLAGVPDFLSDSILGHVSRSSPIADQYTDFSLFEPEIRKLMEVDHFMITSGILE